jgi:membrane protease subunit HflC
VGGLLAAALLLRMVIYQVQEGEVAVVLTFGKPTGEDQTPGPAAKLPWPIQQVRTYDARLRVLKTPLEQTITTDQQTILVGSFLLWRISSAREFVGGLRDVATAEGKLLSALRTAQKTAVAQLRFDELVNADPQRLRYEQAEQAMLQALQAHPDVQGHGVEVKLVGIRRLGLPENVTGAVFARMREERQALAAKVLAEGRAEAGRIRAEAEGRRAALLSQSQAEARRTLAAAEEAIASHYAAFEQAPELAVFLKKVEALRALLDQRTTVVLDSTQPPFDLLRQAGVAPVDSREGR